MVHRDVEIFLFLLLVVSETLVVFMVLFMLGEPEKVPTFEYL